MVNDKLGFECMQILMKANTKAELDECIRIINVGYPVLRERLGVYDEILQKAKELNLKIGYVELKK